MVELLELGHHKNNTKTNNMRVNNNLEIKYKDIIKINLFKILHNKIIKIMIMEWKKK